MQVSVHDLIYIIVRYFRVMRFLLCFGSEHIQLLGHFRLAGGEHMPIHTGYIDGFVSHARGNGGERETHVDQKGDVRVPQIMDADSLYTSSFLTALHFAGQEVFGEGKDSLVRFRLVERLDVILHFVADVLRHLNGSIALFRLGRRDDVLTIQAGIRLADGHGSLLKIEVGRGQRQQLALTESAPVQHFKCVVREGLVHNRL